jgi:LysM repeat protein
MNIDDAAQHHRKIILLNLPFFTHPFIPSFLKWFFILIIFLGIWFSIKKIHDQSITSNRTHSIWQSKSILSYYARTPSINKEFHNQLGLSPSQTQILFQISQSQEKELFSLQDKTLSIIHNTELSLQQKQNIISEMGYNEEIQQVFLTYQNYLRFVLDQSDYDRILQWGDSTWEKEKYRHGMMTTSQFPREYRVYAGQYDSQGAYFVALPDNCVKKANQNDPSCDQHGYEAGKKYDVYISYQGKGVAVRVGDAGPWNNDDNYWATALDPTPRRLFNDLPVGMPEAQAAYFDNYNDGNDQYGRKVIFPTGIEVSKLVAEDIGLSPETYDWVKVAYLWTDGWEDPSLAENAEATEPGLPPILTSTEQLNGSIVHIVQAGESPMGIAEAYGISIEELYGINKLTTQYVLQPGNELIIKVPDRTAIPSWKLTATYQTSPSTTETSIATQEFSASPTIPKVTEATDLDSSSSPTNVDSSGNGKIDEAMFEIIKWGDGNTWFYMVALVVIFGIGFVIAGSLLNRNDK